MWGVATLIAIIAWLKGKKALSGVLAAAIEKAKELIRKYDDAPYTAEDRAKLEAIGVQTKPPPPTL